MSKTGDCEAWYEMGKKIGRMKALKEELKFLKEMKEMLKPRIREHLWIPLHYGHRMKALEEEIKALRENGGSR